MKTLITGGTGYIGSAIADAFASKGHETTVLARNEESAKKVRDAGHVPVVGDLRDLKRLGELVFDADAVVHAANTGGEDAAAVDDAATRGFVAALRGSTIPFVYTSGVWVLGSTGDVEADEESRLNPAELVAWRASLENWLLAEAHEQGGPQIGIVRPGVVYGRNGGIPGMMARGEVPLVDDGNQRWPVVHVEDLAELYVKLVEASLSGVVLHGVGGVVRARDIARSVTGGSYTAMPLPEAQKIMGPFADALALDQVVSAKRTQDLLNWRPRVPAFSDYDAEGMPSTDHVHTTPAAFSTS
jgi:nucleoside-diphosphate-sugar epimerase